MRKNSLELQFRALDKGAFFVSIIILVILIQPEFVELRRRRHANGNALNTQLSTRMKELRDHWSCSSPKPRLVYLKDEKQHLVCDSSISYTPEVAVLFRCEKSFGCCHGNKQCLPATTEEVPILFQKTDHHLRRNFETIIFTNHTSCACL